MPSVSATPKPHVLFAVTVAGSTGLLRPVMAEMTRRGWRVSVLTGAASHDHVAERFPDVAFHFVNMDRHVNPCTDMRALGSSARLMRQLRPDAVIGATPKASLVSMLAAKSAGVPVRVFNVWGVRWDAMSGSKAFVLRQTDRLAASVATDVIAVSDSLADLMLGARITRTRPTVLGKGASKGVDTAVFCPDPHLVEPFTLGYVGRLSQDKGIDDVLAVFGRCQQKYPDCRLVIAGTVDEAQPVSEATQARLRGAGVQWMGGISNTAEVMRRFGLFVFPSVREGLPNAVIEAAASGVPTVGYRATGVVDAVEQGVTGSLVPLRDVDALTEAALSLLGRPEAERMRTAARDFAVTHYAQDRVVPAFVDEIARLLANKSGAVSPVKAG